MTDVSVLRRHEKELAKALLPEDDDPTVPLTDDSRFRTHAYLVLACALVEEHIEETFREYVATSAAVQGPTVSGCFLSLATRFANDLVGQLNAIPRADEAVPMLVGFYGSKVLTPNNGIKKRNLDTLAKPLGLAGRLEGECEDLLTALDVLGAKRGRVAHLGITIDEDIRPAEARGYVLAAIDHLPTLSRVFAENASPPGA